MERNDVANESNKPGFLKLMRTPETHELLHSDPLAFTLLTVIALRARWRTAFNVRGLKCGEALLGDYKAIGLTRQQYRTRLDRLVKCGLLTIRSTRRGTIASLTSTAVFDINLPPPNKRLTNKNQPSNSRVKASPCQPTTNQQPTNSQPLTNNDRKKEQKNDELITVRTKKATTSGHALQSSKAG
jgi:hypothetical protein